MPTKLVLSFNEALDPTSAQDVANYAISVTGGGSVAVTSATYDPVAHTVTLLPAHRLNVHQIDDLRVMGTGPDAVADSAGRPLDGAGTGRPGSDYQTVVTAADLVLGNTVPGGPARLVQLRKAVARMAASQSASLVHSAARSGVSAASHHPGR
jgi:hypothetical protein